MLAIIKSRRDIKYSRQLMRAELLQNAERSERQIGEIKARAKLLEKQVEEWCAENQEFRDGQRFKYKTTKIYLMPKVRKTKKGLALKRWFKEEWVDVRTGKPCGRKKGEKRGTPYCRPKKRVSSKTPKTAGELSASEKRSRIAQKKRLGQPAGKPRRVKAVRRRKKK